MKKILSLIIVLCLVLIQVPYAEELKSSNVIISTEAPISESVDITVSNLDTVVTETSVPVEVQPSDVVITLKSQEGNPLDIVQYDTEHGVGRLVRTIESRQGVEIVLEDIQQVNENEWILTLEAPKKWINGKWKVVNSGIAEAPDKNGYWFYLYDVYYHKLGICQASKVK